MKVFVTGSTGVLGRRAVRHLVAAGHHVTGLARNADRAALLSALGAEPVVGDLFDEAWLGHAMTGHQVVINLATHVPTNARAVLPWAWRDDNRVRRCGSATVVAAARTAGGERLVQESVTFVYPDYGDEWITEQTHIEPTRQHKPTIEASRNALAFGEEDGRTGVVLRLGQLYGPDDGISRYTLARVRAGKPALLGAPDGWRSPPRWTARAACTTSTNRRYAGTSGQASWGRRPAPAGRPPSTVRWSSG